YYHTVELGLGLCFRKIALMPAAQEGKTQKNTRLIGAVVFGSDQGLVGQFNDIITDYAVKELKALPGKAQVWAVGERVYSRLEDEDLPLVGLYNVPNSVKAITPLIAQILVENEKLRSQDEDAELHLYYNRHKTRVTYEPVSQRLLPFDETWRDELVKLSWPTENLLPEVMGNIKETLRALISEYLFVSLFRACAESLASENASRLAAMQRADKNIDDLLDNLSGEYYRVRQSGIDEELFEVISGFEALSRSHRSIQ
ncbi:MAG TPA: F0F1 ATP synthase subunit gamma, partial [Methanosarcina sp.]|nr:F0F1 ATP synthase subunit gamma [Methanosarcina sp.]